MSGLSSVIDAADRAAPAAERTAKEVVDAVSAELQKLGGQLTPSGESSLKAAIQQSGDMGIDPSAAKSLAQQMQDMPGAVLKHGDTAPLQAAPEVLEKGGADFGTGGLDRGSDRAATLGNVVDSASARQASKFPGDGNDLSYEGTGFDKAQWSPSTKGALALGGAAATAGGLAATIQAHRDGEGKPPEPPAAAPVPDTRPDPDVDPAADHGTPGERAPDSYAKSSQAAEMEGGHVPSGEATRIGRDVYRANSAAQFDELLDKNAEHVKSIAEQEDLDTDSGGRLVERKQDLEAWDGKRTQLMDLYYSNRDRLDWASMADVFANLVVQWLAGAKGLATGRTMAGVTYSPQDWSKRYDHLLKESQWELDNIDKEQTREKGSIDETNKRIRDTYADERALQQAKAGAGAADEREFAKDTNEQGRTETQVQGSKDVAGIHAGATIAAAKINREAAAIEHEKNRQLKLELASTQSRTEQLRLWDDAKKNAAKVNSALAALSSAQNLPKSKDSAAAVHAALRDASTAAGIPIEDAIKEYTDSGFAGFGKSMAALEAELKARREELYKEAAGYKSLVEGRATRGSTAPGAPAAPRTPPAGGIETRQMRDGTTVRVRKRSDGKYEVVQ